MTILWDNAMEAGD